MSYYYNGVGHRLYVMDPSLEPPDVNYPEPEPTEDDIRQEKLDYCADYINEFMEFVERYQPDIMDEYIEKYPWQFRQWRKHGYVIGGRK